MFTLKFPIHKLQNHEMQCYFLTKTYSPFPEDITNIILDYIRPHHFSIWLKEYFQIYDLDDSYDSRLKRSTYTQEKVYHFMMYTVIQNKNCFSVYKYKKLVFEIQGQLQYFQKNRHYPIMVVITDYCMYLFAIEILCIHNRNLFVDCVHQYKRTKYVFVPSKTTTICMYTIETNDMYIVLFPTKGFMVTKKQFKKMKVKVNKHLGNLQYMNEINIIRTFIYQDIYRKYKEISFQPVSFHKIKL